jgi:four helix bundle protein
MQPYERFAAWRESYALALATYKATVAFPKHELYGLTSQSRRAAYSVVANLVEGSAKRGVREFRRFLDISIGSLAELSIAFRLARDMEYLEEAAWNSLENQRKRAAFLIWKLYRSLGERGP